MVLKGTYLLVSRLQNPPQMGNEKDFGGEGGGGRRKRQRMCVLDVKWFACMPVKSNEVTKCQQVSILTHWKPIEERREKKWQEREDGNLHTIHFLNAEEFLRFQRWNLNPSYWYSRASITC